MSRPIEDYALIGDLRTAALVSRDGAVEWLCVPRFDSAACFAALLGSEKQGSWTIRPAGEVHSVRRAYRENSLVLETHYVCAGGEIDVIDCMPIGKHHPRLMRVVVGKRGSVPVQMRYVVRFDYGSRVPWVRSVDGQLIAVAGPDALALRSDVPTRGEDHSTVADFVVAAGDRVGFELAYYPSNEPVPESLHVAEAIEATDAWWKAWSLQCTYGGRWRDAVVRSLITLKALTFDPTGGIVAAPTTSLPEELGGVRNWDYRFCWLRDSTFVLYALLGAGYHEGAAAWRDWLLRAIAGAPDRLQIVYGLGGERRMPEAELSWLPGYADSKPVRTGNGAVDQFQLDVYGEVLDSMYQANRAGIAPTADAWAMLRVVMDALEQRWRMPDRGLWEVRGGLQHFTHSKVLAWVGFDRAISAVEQFALDGPVERWRAVRREIFDQVCRYGYDPVRNTFTQFYGSQELDASALLIPLVGFLPASDPRIIGTVAAIERELGTDGFVWRYTQTGENSVDGLPGGEGAFLACNFWLVDNYVLAGDRAKALALFERLLAVRNDLGLLAEEYDPKAKRLLGNFPQAFSHVGLINSALNLSHTDGPAKHRSDEAPTLSKEPAV